jgi:hypothetical protein
VKRGRVAVAAGVLAAAMTGGVAALTIRGSAPAPAGSPTPPASTTTVVRTNLTTTVLTEGALGYGPSAPVVNRLAGTYTELPIGGTTIGFGQVLYRVDDRPVVLLRGATPAWRPFVAGMAPGPDVAQLQADLLALGDATGLYSSTSGRFDTATVDAIERWQVAHDQPATGTLALGAVIFLPDPVVVGAANAAPGGEASPGESPYAVTTTTRIVSVPLNPNLPPVRAGEPVTIVLPTGGTTPGRIVGVGPAAPTTNPPTGDNAGNSSQAATSLAVVAPQDPVATGQGAGVPVQVSLTTQSVRDVLAVPIAALLALAGGGYGVEVVEPSGVHRLVGVTTGAFTGSQVQVAGPAIRVGTRVVVAE